MRKVLLVTALISSFSTFASVPDDTSKQLLTFTKSVTDIYHSLYDVKGPVELSNTQVTKRDLPGFDDPELKGKTYLVRSVVRYSTGIEVVTSGIYCKDKNTCETLYTQPGV